MYPFLRPAVLRQNCAYCTRDFTDVQRSYYDRKQQLM